MIVSSFGFSSQFVTVTHIGAVTLPHPPRISDYRFLRKPWRTELPQAMQSLCTRLTLKFIQRDMNCVVYCMVDPRSLKANA